MSTRTLPKRPSNVAPATLPVAPGSPLLTDRQRWEACGKPDIICTDCLHIGDDVAQRVCEVCGEDEPAGDDHGQHCPACDHEVWWVPKCPDCGAPATWTYGEIKPREFQCIQANT